LKFSPALLRFKRFWQGPYSPPPNATLFYSSLFPLPFQRAALFLLKSTSFFTFLLKPRLLPVDELFFVDALNVISPSKSFACPRLFGRPSFECLSLFSSLLLLSIFERFAPKMRCPYLASSPFVFFFPRRSRIFPSGAPFLQLL